jgi:hypothetical protein
MAILPMLSNPYELSNSESIVGPGNPIKIKGTGLTLYGGGNEKTPTGMSNAASAGGVTPEIVLTAAKEHNLPITSNKEFQEALIKKLASTELGQQQLAQMEKDYGPTKSGSYVDNILGARTQYLLNSLDKVRKIEQIKENEPYPITTTDKGSKYPEKMLVFDNNDKKAAKEYWNYILSTSNTPGAIKYVDSLRKNLAPKGGRYLTTMQEMDPIINYQANQREEYKKKYGEYPPPGNMSQLIVPLPKEKQYEALSKYLGFQQK